MFSLVQGNLPKISKFNVSLMGCGHFCSDFYTNLLPIMLPLLAEKFQLSYSECGALFMIFSVSMNFIQPPVGVFADKHNVNYLMPLSIITGATLACSVGICSNFYLLLLIVLLSGICSSGFHPIAGGVIPLISTPKHQVMATSIFIAGGNLGFAVAPLITAYFLKQFGIDNLLYLAIPAFIVTIFMMQRNLHIKAPVSKNTHIPDIKEMLTNKPLVWFSLSIGFRSWCYCSLLIYLPLLLNSRGVDSIHGATALMVLLLGTVFGGLATGGMATRFGLKRVILISYIVTFVSACVFIYNPSLSVISYTALFMTGAGMYGSTPVAIVWAQRLLYKSAALATSIMLGFTFGLGYIASLITGVAGDFLGLQIGIAVTILPATVIAAIILLMLKEPASPDIELNSK
ncbi:MAG: MFS transporter [Succinivibrio sp.]|nr:MFS transporter [Succinivibrio sp.]